MQIDELRARLAAAIERWYVPREILIRTDGKVRYVVLSKNRQMAATAAVGALAAVVLALGLGWLIADHRLDNRTAEVATAKTAYLELLAEVSQYYDEFAALSRNMEANEAALRGLIEGGTSAAEVDAIEEQLARSQLAREEGLAGSASLKRKLQLFETDLRNVASRNEQLAANIALLQDQLDAAEAEKQALFERRSEMEVQLAVAEVQVAEAEARNAALDGTIEGLEEALAEALAAGTIERATSSELRRKLAALKADLGHSADRRVAAERRLTRAQRRLEGLRNQRTMLLLARSDLDREVDRLEGRIAAMEASQASVVRRLAERTRIGADEVEKTVAMTGIEVESLLRKAATELSGLGGPFVPFRDRPQPDGVQVVLASVAPLDLEMSRWEKLQFVLRSLPLSAPLDHYTIGSTFGTRKDPFNGKLAVHEGLDFSSALGSTVLATAPGTVVFAGRKGGYGRLVEIDHGFGIHTRYAHLQSILVEVGQSVGYRDEIGKLGTSGRSTGPHVHYEIVVDEKPYDPMNFLKAGRYVFKG